MTGRENLEERRVTVGDIRARLLEMKAATANPFRLRVPPDPPDVEPGSPEAKILDNVDENLDQMSFREREQAIKSVEYIGLILEFRRDVTSLISALDASLDGHQAALDSSGLVGCLRCGPGWPCAVVQSVGTALGL